MRLCLVVELLADGIAFKSCAIKIMKNLGRVEFSFFLAFILFVSSFSYLLTFDAVETAPLFTDIHLFRVVNRLTELNDDLFACYTE